MMLQRAASNAYSWWWASHIRTKQSKWLEQNLQDIEEKVQYVLKLLEEEGDSFAKRAEMYYKRRPELISFVEEAYKAYRALAERYDHISTELQNANTTIASVLPDQVPQFALDDDDDDDIEVMARLAKKTAKPAVNVPNVPKLPVKDLKGLVSSAAKKFQPKKIQPRKSMKFKRSSTVKRSGLNKPEATGEIDKLQKEILVMQTEKEFVKSSYESGLAKYWEIENCIKEKQERICNLQDEFGENIVIEDDEARRLMAETAIKSCQEKLVELQEKQEKSLEEAKEEHRRIKELKEKLKPMAGRVMGDETVFMKDDEDGKSVRAEDELEREMKDMMQKKKELESIRDKIKEHFEVDANSPLPMTDMAEKVDDLVNKVTSLETAVSSQTALIQRLRTETNDLQVQINTLEDDKLTVSDDRNELKNKLLEMEDKLKMLQDLDRKFMNQNGHLRTHFDEACCNLDQLSGNLKGLENSVSIAGSEKNEEHVSKVRFKDQDEKPWESKCSKEDKNVGTDAEETVVPKIDVEDTVNQSCPSTGHDHGLLHSSRREDFTTSSGSEKQNSSEKVDLELRNVSEKQVSDEEVNVASNSEAKEDQEKKEEPDWKQLFLKGMEDREKHLLTEYTSVLRSYKDVKKKFVESEIKLKSENAMKDNEIRSLREKLIFMQKGLGESSDLMDLGSSDNQHNGENCMGMMAVEQSEKMSLVEEQFRMNIDELLEENLDFWLRFSTSFSQIQKFDTSIEDLQTEISKLDQRKKQDGSSTAKYSLRSEVRPIYRHLREIQTELSLWLEKGAVLKDELKSRFESLCNIQDEITKALKDSAEDDEFKFTSYQAAKFQGEILNMKQENNKVADELQAGLDHVTTLQLEVEKTLAKLIEEFALSGSKNRSNNAQLQHTDSSRSRVPLRSFIFGTKQKKANKSIFSCMHPSLYRKIKANT